MKLFISFFFLFFLLCLIEIVSANDVAYYEEKSLNFCNTDNNELNNNVISKKEDIEWCKNTYKTRNIKIGKSFGGMGNKDRNKWLSLGCPGIVTIGRPYTCNEKYGLGFIDLWKKNSKSIFSSSSSSDVTCYSSNKANIVCKFQNIILDFSKIQDKHDTRTFNKGFIQIYGTKNYNDTTTNNNIKIPLVIDGIDIINSKLNPDSCHETLNEPIIMMSHDDPYNFGHHLNDVFMVHAMILMSNHNSKESVFFNVDGIRPGGPAGRGHRTFYGKPDEPGLFDLYYQKIFKMKKKGAVYMKNATKICAKELMIQPFPGLSFVWENWAAQDSCAISNLKKNQPSGIYQTLNLRIRNSITNNQNKDNNNNNNDIKKLAMPSTEHIQVLLITRKSKDNSMNAKARVFIDVESMVKQLREFEWNGHDGNNNKDNKKIKVITQDFGKISFEDQIRLIHSSHIIMGVHGAAMAHGVHMAIGAPNCCAMIELFPPKRFAEIWGYGNIVRHTGGHYFKVITKSYHGIELSPQELKAVFEQAMNQIHKHPSCVVRSAYDAVL